ncbi:hypothetical protein [Streptococcus sp. oral taxon 431]|uniref:hypothetical protein n=1 Tax=Streptococcus sp. oral taxon 431 TaxID=712633 RepID=UPI0012371B99
MSVTTAPGVTFVTTIERFGNPPVSLIESAEIVGACGFTAYLIGTRCFTRTPVPSTGNSTSTSFVNRPTLERSGAPSIQVKLVLSTL